MSVTSYIQFPSERIYLINILQEHIVPPQQTALWLLHLPLCPLFHVCPPGPPIRKRFQHKPRKTRSIIHPKCYGADDNSPHMNYRWELSSAFLCLDPLPPLPSMPHSHDLISPAACCRDTHRNRWLQSNISLFQGCGRRLLLAQALRHSWSFSEVTDHVEGWKFDGWMVSFCL